MVSKAESSHWSKKVEAFIEGAMERRYAKVGDSVDEAIHKFQSKAEDFVDSAVNQVQRKVVRPITVAARALAFSIILVVVGIVSFILFVIGLFRFVDTYLFASHQWLSYMSIGALFILLGLCIYRFRISRKARRS